MMPTEKLSATNGSTPLNGHLDAAVCEIVNTLDAGDEVDLHRLAAGNEALFSQLQKLLPTLEAMVDLGHTPAPRDVDVAPADPQAHTLGDFRILREVGRGGMGVVYEAEQISLGRRVALKVLPFAAVLDRRQLERFKNEARAAAALRHPNIVSVHAVGCDRSVHYYAMEFIEGQSLADVIALVRCGQDTAPKATDRGTAVGPAIEAATTSSAAMLAASHAVKRGSYIRSIVVVVEQAARALHHAHQVGIVHRDVKPSNLMIDASGSLWVTDFGLATAQGESTLTMTGDLIGTLRYMSPEQLEARPELIDHRTDIYSLGVTLYELLALRSAFDATDRQQLLRQLLEQDPPSLQSLDSAVDPDLETVVLKATSKEPQDRYSTAMEFADDLRRFLDRKPVLARRPTRWHRFTSWVTRNPKAAAGIGIVASLLTVLAIAGPVVAVRQTQLRRRVQDQLYDRDMKIAQEALNRGDYDRVSRILREHIPDQASKIDRRHFEWQFLDANSQRGLDAQKFDHWVKIHDAQLSPDGRQLAVGAWDGKVRVYDVHSENRVWHSDNEHDHLITDVTYSPDGRVLATVGVDHKVVFWEASNGRRLHQLELAPDNVSHVVFSPDGAFLACGISPTEVGLRYSSSNPAVVQLFNFNLDSVDGQLHLNLAQGRRLAGATGRVELSFSSDSKLLAGGSDDGRVQLWEIPSGRLLEPLPALGASVFSIAFSPDRPHLLACGTGTFNLGWVGGDVRLWDVEKRELFDVFTGHTGGVRRVAFSQDGTRLASASADRTARVWDVESGELLDVLRGHAGTVSSVSFMPDGQHIASASFDNTVRIWNVATDQRPAVAAAHFDSVNDLAFSSDDALLATGGGDGVVRIWDTASGEELREIVPEVEQILSVDLARDGTRLLAGGGHWPQKETPGGLSLWDATTGEPLATLHPSVAANGKHEICWSAVFSPDQQRVVAAIGNHVIFYDVAKRRELFRGEHSSARRVRWAPNGEFVASVAMSPNSTLQVWDAETGVSRYAVSQREFGKTLLAVAISPDSKTLAVQTDNFDVALLDAASGERKATLTGHTDLIFYLDWHPRGGRLVSVSTDNTCRVWNVETQAELLMFRDAPSWVLSARFSHDGKLLVAGEASSLFGRMAPIRFYDSARLGIQDKR